MLYFDMYLVWVNCFGLLHRDDYFILIELTEFFFSFSFFFLLLPFPRGFQGFVYPLMVC